MISEDKSILRKTIKDEIASFSDEYIKYSDDGIYQNVVNLKEFIDAESIFIYYSIDREPATHLIAQKALDMGKTVAFPLCYKEGVMDAHIVSNLNEFDSLNSVIGIPSPNVSTPIILPNNLELVIVPALAYNFEGYRLGLGGGYFDRYLDGLSVFTVGLAREKLMKYDIPIESHDVPVSCIATESGIYRTDHRS